METFTCPKCAAPQDYRGGNAVFVRCSHCGTTLIVPDALRTSAPPTSEARRELSSVQSLFLKFMPATWRASAEAESKQWMLKCPECSFERSYWDAGGLRWKASGSPRIGGVCPKCHKNVMFRVYKKQAV